MRDVGVAHAIVGNQQRVRWRNGDGTTAIESSRDQKTGLAIHSLYGKTLRPTAAMLDGLDLIVVDLQDIGARIYTYPAAIAYVMEEAAAPRSNG